MRNEKRPFNNNIEQYVLIDARKCQTGVYLALSIWKKEKIKWKRKRTRIQTPSKFTYHSTRNCPLSSVHILSFRVETWLLIFLDLWWNWNLLSFSVKQRFFFFFLWFLSCASNVLVIYNNNIFLVKVSSIPNVIQKLNTKLKNVCNISKFHEIDVGFSSLREKAEKKFNYR